MGITYEEFADKYKINLTEQQLTAMKSVEGANLLLAVPGSGKTTVLIARLGYMIYCCDIAPESILVITYTVAATKEMKGRFKKLFGDEYADRIEFRTINGICSLIINYYEHCLGKKFLKLVPNEGHIIAIISKIYMKYHKEYPEENVAKAIRLMITYIKNMMLKEEEILSLPIDEEYMLDIYKDYVVHMRDNKLMDYDDQMIYARRILLKNESILKHYQDKYKYICVDESQDTSKIQHEVIKILANKHKNIFMVGDEDQSIYGFRAAYPEALLEFKDVYNDANVLLMEENFRSTKNIVNAANKLIHNNIIRFDKTICKKKKSGEDIHTIDIGSRYEQYTYLVDALKDVKEETAILYRANESVIPLVDLLDRHGIEFRMRSQELDFFTHPVVAQFRNIMRFIMDPKDTDTFMKIYFKVIKYMPKAIAEEICDIAENNNIDIFEAAHKYRYLKYYLQNNIEDFHSDLKRYRQYDASKLLRAVYNLDCFKDDSITRDKYDILNMISYNVDTPQEFLNRIDELENIIASPSKNNSPIILSSIHSSKGLEYNSVYLIDIIDGIFPRSIPIIKDRNNKEYALFEEERRMFYVAMTRAKKQLNIFNLVENNDSVSSFCQEAL